MNRKGLRSLSPSFLLFYVVGGRWVLRRVSESKASQYCTTSERAYCWKNLRESKATDLKKSESHKGVFEPNVTELSKIMKRDALTRVCPWISTTHRDFYGQRHPKLTGRMTEISASEKEPRTEDMDKLISCVTHVPAIRMICYNDGHFDTVYKRDFADTTRVPELPAATEKEDYNFPRKSANPHVPYSSKKWTTTYRFDYTQSPPLQDLAPSSYNEPI